MHNTGVCMVGITRRIKVIIRPDRIPIIGPVSTPRRMGIARTMDTPGHILIVTTPIITDIPVLTTAIRIGTIGKFSRDEALNLAYIHAKRDSGARSKRGEISLKLFYTPQVVGGVPSRNIAVTFTNLVGDGPSTFAPTHLSQKPDARPIFAKS